MHVVGVATHSAFTLSHLYVLHLLLGSMQSLGVFLQHTPLSALGLQKSLESHASGAVH